MIDGSTFLDFAGGALSVVVQRAPTSVPGEMVTIGALVEWRHDARVTPRPEQFEQPTPQAEIPQQAEEIGERELEPAGPEIDPADGFDYSKLAPEDIDEPVPSR